MSNEESPFSNDVNPFADPSVALHTEQQYKGHIDDYNPFEAEKSKQTNVPVLPATIEPTRSDPVPAFEPKPFSSEGYEANQSAVKRQEDLERKVAQMEKNEQDRIHQQQMKASSGYQNNFPPFPKWCPVGPCFFHDINLEIPVESQKTCKLMYYIWQLYLFTVIYNCVASLAYLCDGGNDSAVTFGVSILYMVVNPCLTYLFWYSRLYNALRRDSSANYMLFFFSTFFFIIVKIIYALGFSTIGTCGWINATSHLNNSEKHKAVAIIMYVSAILWTIQGLLVFLMLRKIHYAYRHSGASWEKAQGEFAQGIASNKAVQNAAAEGAKAGVSNVVSGTQY